MKPKKDSLCLKSTRELAAMLNGCVDRGGRVVAMMGAGLSKPSGVPLIFEIKSYLESCIALAMQVAPGATRNRSIPRLTGWPTFRELRERMPQDNTPEDLLKAGLAAARRAASPRAYLLEQALGAATEWRTALQFLARLTIVKDDTGEELRLAEVNQTVIDQLFWRLTVDRAPSLGHHMLAALAKRLRIDLILTPNFDTLIEQAFLNAEMAITPFDVHLSTGFPPAELVLDSTRPVIKMHGSNFGLRADFSLDAPPASEDVENFCKYISGRKDLLEGPDKNSSPVLLVAGIGGDEPI